MDTDELEGRAQSALRAMAKALYALFLIIVTTVAIFIRLFAEALYQAFQLIARFAVAISRMTFVLLEVVVVFWISPQIFNALGGDLPALIPTAVVIIIPLVLAVGSGYGWNGVLASAIITAIIGELVVVGGTVVQTIVLTSLVTGLFVYKIIEHEKEYHAISQIGP